MSLRTKYWIFGVTLSLAVALVSCGKPDPNSPAIFHSSADYAQALSDVQKLTQGPFEAMHEGFPINAEEKENLKEASHLIDGMIVYNPQTYAPYILKGLTLRALGDKEGAMKNYLQGVALAPKQPVGDDIGSVARIYDELGTLYYEENDYAEAEKYGDMAIKLVPNDPSILTNTASTKIQLKKVDEALVLIDAALKRAPTYSRAIGLKKLLGPPVKSH